jgi:hypothetical protein
MDPTWIARFRSPVLEADVFVFRGPYIDVAAFRPNALELGAFVGGEENFNGARLVAMLNDMAAASRGGPLRLRRALDCLDSSRLINWRSDM